MIEALSRLYYKERIIIEPSGGNHHMTSALSRDPCRNRPPVTRTAQKEKKRGKRKKEKMRHFERTLPEHAYCPKRTKRGGGKKKKRHAGTGVSCG
jgi:hypothetical protein